MHPTVLCPLCCAVLCYAALCGTQMRFWRRTITRTFTSSGRTRLRCQLHTCAVQCRCAPVPCCAVLSGEILATYNDEDIYLFRPDEAAPPTAQQAQQAPAAPRRPGWGDETAASKSPPIVRRCQLGAMPMMVSAVPHVCCVVFCSVSQQRCCWWCTAAVRLSLTLGFTLTGRYLS